MVTIVPVSTCLTVCRGLRIAFSSDRPRTSLVMIAAPGALEPAALQRHFDACLTENLTWRDHLRLSLSERLRL
jgi:hypothetical protein